MAACNAFLLQLRPSSRSKPLLPPLKCPFSPHLRRLHFATGVSPPLPARLAPRRNPLPRRAAPVRCLFTGIVEEMGRVRRVGPSPDGSFELEIAARTVLGDVGLGHSIAVNGACLTVTRFDAAEGFFAVGLSPETLRRTSLGGLRPGSPVNLERSLLPSSRMGGHFVQGHVDGTGEIASMEPEGDSLWVRVRALPELLRLVVPKGYVAVDGTSLTVVQVDDGEGWFNFMLVAYTQKEVVIPLKKVGEKVNLEVDVLGKYIERLLKSGLDVAQSSRS